ncbi:MAG: transcription antitermination factor NusB [Anaerovibrio sp.]|nr:transcription antitermination factor NusB [Selenomonadaceae bacterium]MDY6053183.1 transcription antitermination factor NusB [Anaerovibrio sp.]
MSRTQAREVALQALFQFDFNPAEQETDLDEAVTEAIDTAVTGDEESEVLYSKDRSYAEGLVMGTLENQQAIDEILEQHARDWSIDRMAAVDRNIARMAVFELKFQEEKVDTAVIINEAVNLAKKFGTDDSSRFINGILSSVEKA